MKSQQILTTRKEITRLTIAEDYENRRRKKILSSHLKLTEAEREQVVRSKRKIIPIKRPTRDLPPIPETVAKQTPFQSKEVVQNLVSHLDPVEAPCAEEKEEERDIKSEVKQEPEEQSVQQEYTNECRALIPYKSQTTARSIVNDHILEVLKCQRSYHMSMLSRWNMKNQIQKRTEPKVISNFSHPPE